MGANRTLAGLGYLPSTTDSNPYAAKNGKWAVVVSSAPTVTAWTNITAFASGASAGSPAPQYRKNGDVVEFRGVVNTGGLNSNNDVSMFTMPSGFRTTVGGSIGAVVAIPTFVYGGASGALIPADITTNGTGLVSIHSPQNGTSPSAQVPLEAFRYAIS